MFKLFLFTTTVLFALSCKNHQVSLPVVAETSTTSTMAPSTTTTMLIESQSPVIEQSQYMAQGLSWEQGQIERLGWSQQAFQSVDFHLSKLLKAKDLPDLCPKFNSLNRDQKVNVLAELISQLAKYESGWNPKTMFPECNKNKCIYSNGCQYVKTYGYCMKGGHKLDGGVVISRGLTQISLQSAQAYGCDVAVPNDLHDPFKNISCTVRILANRVDKYQRIIFRDGHYWAVLKPTVPAHQKIKDGMRVFSLCK